MAASGFIIALGLLGALLFAVVIAVVQTDRTAKLIGFFGCALLAVAPLIVPYAAYAFGGFVVAVNASALINHRRRSRRH